MYIFFKSTDESSGDEENENDDNDNDEGATKNSENSTTEPDDAVVFEGHDGKYK